MTHDGEGPKARRIERILQEAHDHLSGPQAETAETFLGQYYARIPPADILAREPADLMGAALAHLRFAEKVRSGRFKVRAYNPNHEEHGWDSPHTVVEIVGPDQPFLVNSVNAELLRHVSAVHLVIHPVMRLQRAADGTLERISKPGADAGKGAAEAFMHFQISRQPASRLDELRAKIERILEDVAVAVADWQPMRARLSEVIAELRESRPPLPDDEIAEIAAFLQWMLDDNFVLLGYRAHVFAGNGARLRVGIDAEAGLGLLRDPGKVVFRELADLDNLRPEVRAVLAAPDLLDITKTDVLSTVHRPAYMDLVAVKRFGPRGRIVGQHVFAGLMASSAYNRSARDIPLLRRKVRNVLERADLTPGAHDAKALINILETYPRDELFQVSEDHLLKTSLGVLDLQERQRVALFLRRDPFDRFMVCLVYVPRDRYSTDLRRRIQGILEHAFNGTSAEWYAHLGDSAFARLLSFVRLTPGTVPDYDAQQIEDELAAAARSWVDHLAEVLIETHGEEKGDVLGRRYQRAFREAYRERFPASAAVADIEKIEPALESGTLGMGLRRPLDAGEHRIRFKLYHPGGPVPLSDTLPLLEHMGLRVMDEFPYPVRPEGGGYLVIHDFGLEMRDGRPIDLVAVREAFREAFGRVWRGDMESDGFNALVVRAGLTWRQVVLLRAYCKYLRQAGIAFSQAYMEETLAENPELAALLVALFEARLDPALDETTREKKAGEARERLRAGLQAVENADQDRIIRRFVNVIEATLRTNFFQPAADGAPKPYVSFKLDSGAVTDLPLPRPWVEVWVYSPRMEGVHLRGGPVARGGVRWSDRREDFRTEILGLMKAQMVKNTVIVPVGAKGGFVVKRPPAEREALRAEGIECYKTLVRGLLDVTDNLDGATLIRPERVVRRDGDDPYLVVAADKGTATFSDIANAVSADYGFWLGDAFASGGSFGYDHKKMGITARGAWESVKRHFREMGTDIQAEDFTVVGVGDMAGDVFGNGMLLSPHIRLVAAFNHQHIFLDPDADAATGFAERKRLFEAVAGWGDYDRAKLSKGGMIVERRVKSIEPTPEIKAAFGIEADSLTPADLIKALLKAPVDLLWFGGIGTFVKAAAESQADAGDRANDAVRVNARELRCRVVGEGANLGLTQRARIEYALAGGRLNTDAIDNSAGVDTSDHEVNIKILLNAEVATGNMTLKQRNALLSRMTDEVAALTLRDNYLQSLAITVIQAEGAEALEDQARLMRFLERAGRLNRAVEFLPDEEALAERAAAKEGLSRPEIAVLMSYAKLWLYDEILASDLPEDPRLANDLVRYFPEPLREAHGAAIVRHPLRREIIATTITNSVINRVGGTFVTAMMEETGLGAADVARAYLTVRKVFVLRDVWAAIEALDGQASAEVQIDLLGEINRLVWGGTLWFMRHGKRPLDIEAQVRHYRGAVQTLTARFADILPAPDAAELEARAAPYVERGVPADLARRVAAQIFLISALDLTGLAVARKVDVAEAARFYFALGRRFRLGFLRARAGRLEGESYWHRLAAGASIEEIYAHQLALTAQVLDGKGEASGPDEAIERWGAERQGAVARTDQMLAELGNVETVDLPMIAVVSRQIAALAAAGP